jgi:hypothetical protein
MNAVAVATAVAAALLFGVSSVADQRSTKRIKPAPTTTGLPGVTR